MEKEKRLAGKKPAFYRGFFFSQSKKVIKKHSKWKKKKDWLKKASIESRPRLKLPCKLAIYFAA